jgi:Family of unknown function (DUF5343)
MNTILTPPYATFDTFIQILNKYKENGIPSVINKETFEDYTRHNKWQLLGAFKFLGLIDEYGTPTPDFNYLIIDESRQATLRQLIQSAYALIFEKDIMTIKRDELDSIFRNDYKINGETLKKARTFFTHACKFAQISMSQNIATRKRRKFLTELNKDTDLLKELEMETDKQSEEKNMQNEEMQDTQNIISQPAFTNIINLKSGGKLTLSVEVDIWELNKADRDFVFEIKDSMKEYEDSQKDA